MQKYDRADMLPARRRLLFAGSLLVLGSLAQGRRASASADTMSEDVNDHQHHRHAPTSEEIKRTEVTYKIPGLILVRQDGAKVEFPAELDDGRAVILAFIYTSCTAVCPITSQVFSQLQEKLGRDRDRVNMVSISIDPEYDTPARLSEYARKFHAAKQWQHYTGTTQASIAMQKAFDVYRGDKMNHSPVTLLRAAPGKPWVRLEGFASPDMLVHEFRALVKGA